MKLLKGMSAVVLVLLLATCSGEYPQSSIDPRTDFAESIHSLYQMIFWITLGILALVWGVLAYVLVRFRARPEAPLPRQIRGHMGLELVWTILPAVIVVVIAIPTIQTVFRTQRAPDSDALVVDVIGHQFWWEVRYPNGVVTANDLHLPVGRPVSLRLRSADVIHSFWVPMIGGKRDLNPVVRPPEGDTVTSHNWLHFTIREEGVYRGQCAEFCGQSHSLMGVRVVAESEADFQAWMDAWNGSSAPDTIATDALGGAAAARIELGRQTFHSSTCVVCHAIQGTSAGGVIGPNLTLMGRRSTLVGWLENTPKNLVKWITAPHSVKPGAMMPGVTEPGGQFPPTDLSEEQVRGVAEYLWSLGRSPAQGGG